MQIMEKIKSILFLLLSSFLILNCEAQETPVLAPGLLSSQCTFTPSHMFCDKQTYIYIHGGLECYITKKLSVTGEIYYNAGALSHSNTFDYNHSLFFGSNWHFTKANNDFFLGLHPGLSLTKLNAKNNNITETSAGINPLISAVVGYNFFINKYFHFFLDTRYILGDHNYDIHKSLSELKFSAGLGFNLNTKKLQ